MEQNYQVLTRRAQLNKEEFLAVGIMDTGSKADLENTILWYKKYFNYCIHVITQTNRFTQDELTQTYSNVSFILFDKAPTLAERVNALANTCMTTYFLLVRSDTELVELNWHSIMELFKPANHPVCVTPLIFNKDKELVPTVRAPRFKDDDIDPMSFMPSHGNDTNLYPFLGVGIYDRALFQRLRGFDELLLGAYWQSLDFGVRTWLYGYSVCSTNNLAFIFPNKQYLIEDRSETKNAERFYTKALGVKLVRDRIHLKKAYKVDKHLLAEEVKPKLALYKTDFDHLIANWKVPEK